MALRFAEGHRDFVMSHGEVFTTLGEPKVKSVGTEALQLPFDMMSVTISQGESFQIQRFAVSHVTVGHWLSRHFTVVTNSGRYRSFDIAPRAHPNDGFLDLMEIDPTMSLRQRMMARHRALIGTHIPHPSIRVSRSKSVTLVRQGTPRLYIDGVVMNEWDTVHISVLPDACFVYV
jgi:diacylglycerol kinase family enzyme